MSGVHSAQAQSPPGSFSLDYTAPPVCPDRARFVAAILERAPEAREVSPESARFRFEAHLEQTSATLARGVVSVEQEGSSSRREVAEAPCVEVMESMAVILSLIVAGTEPAPSKSPVAPAAGMSPVAPAAGTARATAPTPPSQQAASAPAPAEAAPKPRTEPAPAARTRARASPAPAKQPAKAEPPEPTPDAPPPASERWRLGLRLAALTETGVAPNPTLGGQAGLDLWWARDSTWSPSTRLSARYVRSGVETTDYGSARFELAALRAEICPARWPARTSTFGRVCGLFDAGRLDAEPERAAAGETVTQTMPWIGGGGSIRLESALVDAVSLEAAADLVALGRADRFTFEPGSHTVHQVPRISAMFSLGAVLRLP